MEHINYAQVLSARILALRREKGMTQEALAERLDLSFQAVSKWENGQSCPDIALLPLLADIFGVSVDHLFGREDAAKQPGRESAEIPVVEPVFEYCHDLPWPDDDTLRGVVALGHKLLGYEKVQKKKFFFDAGKAEYTWLLRYSPLNVECRHHLHVEGEVQRDAKAGTHMSCKDVGGSANAGTHMSCGDVDGDVSAGSHLTCGGVGGDVSAGSHITCGGIGRDASAGGNIKCGDIRGDAEAGDSIECKHIGGNAQAEKITINK